MDNNDKLKILTDLKNELNTELTQISLMKESFNTLMSNINSVCSEYLKIQTELESSVSLIDPLFEKIQILLQESPFKKFHDRHTDLLGCDDSIVIMFYILYEAKRFGGYAHRSIVTDFIIPFLIYGNGSELTNIQILFENHSSIDNFLSFINQDLCFNIMLKQDWLNFSTMIFICLT